VLRYWKEGGWLCRLFRMFLGVSHRSWSGVNMDGPDEMNPRILYVFNTLSLDDMLG